jgi:hypothetical protein
VKHTRILFLIAILLVGIVGCSSTSNPVASKPANTATSTWVDSTGGFWRSHVDASSYSAFAGFSFTSKDTVTSGVPKVASSLWDIAFRRDVIKLNGGTSTNNGGDCIGADLGAVDFTGVTKADSASATWSPDAIAYFIDNWYDYNTLTHALTMNRRVYSMLDASGHHYVKFQIDSLKGAGAPPNMGTVYLTYYYQDTVDSKSLAGAVSHASIAVNGGTGYFKFSSGLQVTPSNPSQSTDWDLAFNSYNVIQNDGPNGPGACAAFFAYTTLVDPTDIAGFTLQPSGVPMFPDAPSSALTAWYDYNGTTHQLTSKNHIYLIKTGGMFYKVRIESYYTNVGGLPASAHYTFVWKQL